MYVQEPRTCHRWAVREKRDMGADGCDEQLLMWVLIGSDAQGRS